MLITFALDTATPSPALAIVAGDDVVAELTLEPSPAGGRRVMECVHRLMVESGRDLDTMDRVVVGVGPGGFTGLRIGIATAMGLAQALGVPAVGASSLEALALGVAAHTPSESLVAPVIDARRREVFGALYRAAPDGGLEELLAPAAWVPADFAAALLGAATGHAVFLGGDGVPVLAPHLGRETFAPLPAASPGHRVRAADLVRRVDSGAGLPAVPHYLRLPDAEMNLQRVQETRMERPAA